MRRVRTDIENGSKAFGKHKEGLRRHGQNFGKFGASGKKNGQASDFGDSGNEWNGLIKACGKVKEIIIEENSLRILFDLGIAANRSGDLKKHKQVSPKGKIGQDREKAMQALRDELDKLKRLFELKKWHSNTLETWVYPREETRRSLNRLIRAMDEEYQLLCKRKAQEKKAQELKEEGFAANPVTKFPSCENKESQNIQRSVEALAPRDRRHYHHFVHLG